MTNVVTVHPPAVTIGHLDDNPRFLVTATQTPAFASGAKKNCFEGNCTDLYTGYSFPVAMLIRMIRATPHANELQLLSLRYEVRNLCMINYDPNLNPFFVRFYGLCGPYLIFRLCNSTLQDIIERKLSFTYDVRVRFMLQAFIGLSFLHQRNWVHLDIKPNNIFIVGRTVVFGDVETLRHVDEPNAQEICGAYCFSPRETLPFLTPIRCILRPDKTLPLRDLKGHDIWSLALSTYGIFYLRYPGWTYQLGQLDETDFEGADKVIANMKFPPFPEPIDDIEAFLNLALEPNPEIRPSANALYNRLSGAIY